MLERRSGQKTQIIEFDGHDLDRIQTELFWNEVFKRTPQGQLSQADLDGNLS